METDIREVGAAFPCPPLSAEEESAWALMVEQGRKLRGDILARREKKPSWVKKMSKSDSMGDIPVRTRRWLICRMAGMSFRRAGEASGATWLDMQDAKAHSEEFRCALAAQEQNSRDLMRAKAQSVVEQSQEEDAKVSMAQTQVSMRILECLDPDHFGERKPEVTAEDVKKAVTGGGFVINLVQDAAKAAEAVPVKKPGKALVYSEV